MERHRLLVLRGVAEVDAKVLICDMKPVVADLVTPETVQLPRIGFDLHTGGKEMEVVVLTGSRICPKVLNLLRFMAGGFAAAWMKARNTYTPESINW